MNKQRKNAGFWRVYWWIAAGLVLLAAAALTWFWFFINAYEHSRPQTTIDAYLRMATPEWISSADTAIPGDCDLYLQDEALVRDLIAESIGTVTCLRDTKRSGDTRIVYAVMNGTRRIGSVALEVEKTDIFGFEHWKVASEEYDFSHLLGSAATVTVPSGYRVYANGRVLDDDYITAKGIHFEVLEDYYDSYKAPTLCTYTTGRIFGIPVLTVKDLNGEPVDMETEGAIEDGYCNCSTEETEALKKFGENYVKWYVRFSSAWGGKGNRYYNHKKLAQYIEPGSDLAERMKSAIDAIYWVGDHNAKIQSTKYNHLIRMEEGVYLCDLTYTVNQKVKGGRADSTVNLRLVVVQTENGLKAVSMLIY